MSSTIELIETDMEGMFLTIDNQPSVVISETNGAGWREVMVGIHVTTNEKEVLKDLERYLVEELSLKQNNDFRGWKWDKVLHEHEGGMRFFVTNVRNSMEEIVNEA